MVRRLTGLSVGCLVFAGFLHIGCGKGTETGNPGQTTATQGSSEEASEGGTEEAPAGGPVVAEKSYENTQYGILTAYLETWKVTEMPASSPMAADDGDPTAEPAPVSGIDTSSAPATVFTDGTSTVTLYYVGLSSDVVDLGLYLVGVFPGRTFEVYENSDLSGFTYDNPEAGDNGGDRAEYYFMKEALLLYLVTDIDPEGGGETALETILANLRFSPPP